MRVANYRKGERQRMMTINNRVSTGIKGLDGAIDMLRLGDNVVWQVDAVPDYKRIIEPYVQRAREDGRSIVYIRFSSHEALIDDLSDIKLYQIEANEGFESFVLKISSVITEQGKLAFYVFDCLTDLLHNWYSDLMIGNFFTITCPALYELDTVAYFALIRNMHTNDTIARIRETTQVLIDLYSLKGSFYVHPLKVWQRYSPTMFLPHRLADEQMVSITSSADTAALFAGMNFSRNRRDHWEEIFQQAREMLAAPQEEQEEVKNLLLLLLIGKESRIVQLCRKYFTLEDLLQIENREIGTGFIGGKTVGMLLARKILEKDAQGRFADILEPHDSYYLGSDVFYTYIVQNGWWTLRSKHKTKSGYQRYAHELREKMLGGRFPEKIRESFQQMLEYFGQSPIIVRSSSLLEDNFGNAFAGKYESVFCVNQGTPEERYNAFEQAVRVVYASTMNEDALAYRLKRGLFDKDEQMALLVQRVSGDYYDKYFFPHVAGVGNSSNLYVWDKSIDMEAGMLRLVFGLGTRAVDRVTGDYPRIVCLDKPTRPPLMVLGDERRFSQHRADVLSIADNDLIEVDIPEALSADIKADKSLFAEPDEQANRRSRELGLTGKQMVILSFKKLLAQSGFPEVMRDMLKLISATYEYPVDIEFTTNFRPDGDFKVNLLQCRPLQTRGLGKAVQMPNMDNTKDCLFVTKGGFMGGNVRLGIDYVVHVDTKGYMALSESDKYSVARLIGRVNNALKKKSVMLIGPGRWGTTTPSLGVPVKFSEICNAVTLCEVSSQADGFMPELSYGSHLFQDLVETGIFYAALFDGTEQTIYHPARLLEMENQLEKVVPSGVKFAPVLRVVSLAGLVLYSDIITQTVVCK